MRPDVRPRRAKNRAIAKQVGILTRDDGSKHGIAIPEGDSEKSAIR